MGSRDQQAAAGVQYSVPAVVNQLILRRPTYSPQGIRVKFRSTSENSSVLDPTSPQRTQRSRLNIVLEYIFTSIGLQCASELSYSPLVAIRIVVNVLGQCEGR